MFGLFNRIKFNKSMTSLINEYEEFLWFENIDKEIELNLNYGIKFVNKEDAISRLSKKRNYKGRITLENLIIEANSRASEYLYQNYRKHHQKTWNKLVKKINKLEMFRKIKEKEAQFLLKNKVENIHLDKILRGALTDLYFKDITEEYPTFYIDIISVYRLGKIIIGWEGKFPHENNFTQTKIMKNEGKLIIL